MDAAELQPILASAALRLKQVPREASPRGVALPRSPPAAPADVVIAHGNQRFRVVSVIPVERMAEFVESTQHGLRSRSLRPCNSQT